MQNRRWWFPANLMYKDCEGRIFDLVKELIYSEMPTFPRARYDDMLDALSRVYEDNLGLVFPKPKTGLKQKMLNEIMLESEDSSWLGY